jgi:hypothetical protein
MKARKTVHLIIRITEEEKKVISKRAKILKITPTKLVRRSLNHFLQTDKF